MELRELAELGGRLLDEVERAVVGKREQLELVLLGMLADGHVLLEDVPGLAKTLAARSFAEASGLGFSRVQFTPDLLPSDVTGSSIWNQRDGDFEFRSGPIFTNLLLADEINRAPPKTQAALLEAMQERQVTIDGVTRPLERPFLVLATQNPIEYEGTYPLPEAQLDRFLLRDRVRLPAARRRVGDARPPDRAPGGRGRARRRWSTARPCSRCRRPSSTCTSSRRVGRYIVDIVAATRESTSLAVGASPRGSLALLKLSRCRAALAGRDFVTPDDVKAIAVPALAHRLMLRPELWVQRRSGEDVVRETLDAGADAARRGRRASGRRDAVRVAPARAVRRPRRPRPARGARAPPARARRRSRRRSRCIVAVGLLCERPPELRAWLTLDRDRALEGDEIDAEIELNASTTIELLELHPRSSRAGLAVVEGDNPCGVRLAAGEERTRAAHAPLRPLGRRSSSARSALRARGRIGMLVWEGRMQRPHRLQVYPRPELLRSLVAPLDTQLATGDLVARVRADGLEFADTRAFVPATASARSTGGPAPAAASWSSTSGTPSGTPTSSSSSTASRRRAAATRRTARSSAPCGPRRRSPAATSSAATASGSSRSAAFSAGSSPAAGSSSATAWSTRCSRPGSSSATRGRTSTSSRPARCRRRRS